MFTALIVHPREVFKAILLSDGAPFLMAHNPPGGEPWLQSGR
jgi:DNA repair protein RadC